MRIVVFVEFFPPNMGSDRRIYEIMIRLSKSHDIHFLVLPPFRMLSGQISSAQGRLHSSGQEIIKVEEGVTAHYLSVSPLMLKLWKKSYALAYLLTMWVMFSKVFKAAKEINPETLVLNYPSVYTGVLGFVIGKILLRKPLLLDFNDLIAQYTLQLLGIDPRSITARLFVLIQDYIVMNSTKIVASTNYIKKYTSNLMVPDKRIVVIPNGVDTNHFDPKRHRPEPLKSQLRLGDKRTCVYCGRLDSWAGTRIILQLCRRLSVNRDLFFIVVGSGVEQREFFADNVVSTGAIPYDKVPEFLAVADIVLVPFPDNAVSRAASPLKLFEAMSMEKAIVAGKVDGVEEVIRDRENGFLVDPEDISQWAFAIAELLSDGLIAGRIGENARRTVREKYDWQLLADRYQKILVG